MGIKIANLSFKYNQLSVLEDISFIANKGDFIALLGPNGSGKSTLLKCILGYLDTYTGNILIDDIDIKKLTNSKLYSIIAYVPQQTNIIFDYSVEEIILMGMTNQISTFGHPKNEDVEKVKNIAKKLDILNIIDRNYNELSGGEKQLTLIARALAQNAKVLLLDEPVSSLDYGHQYKVLNIVSKLSENGYTVIMSTHDPNQAFLYTNKAIAIKNGKLLGFGKTEDVLTSDVLSYMYEIPVSKRNIEFDKGRYTTICVVNGFKRPTMSLWHDDMIKYMVSASKYTKYHNNLMLILKKYIDNSDTIIDVGSGIGLLSFELADISKEVTSIDINENAIRYIIEYNDKNNLKAINSDVYDYVPDEKFDIAVFNYFGKFEDILSLSRKLCRKRIIVISRNSDKSGFSLSDKTKRDHNLSFFSYLDKNNIKYIKNPYEIEFGQPFYSKEDAYNFFEIYNNESVDEKEIDSKLVKIDNDEYKYYYSYKKKILISIIEMDDLFEKNI